MAKPTFYTNRILLLLFVRRYFGWNNNLSKQKLKQLVQDKENVKSTWTWCSYIIKKHQFIWNLSLVFSKTCSAITAALQSQSPAVTSGNMQYPSTHLRWNHGIRWRLLPRPWLHTPTSASVESKTFTKSVKLGKSLMK